MKRNAVRHADQDGWERDIPDEPIDWFVGYSPRSDGPGEGSWDHWVELALQILHHPATAIVYPEAHAAVASVKERDYYNEQPNDLTPAQIRELFYGVAP